MLIVLLFVAPAVACGSSSSGPEVALPDCDRASDHTTIHEDGCLQQTARALGHDGASENSFQFAYRVCYDDKMTTLVQDYGGGTEDPEVIARTLSNQLFTNDAAEEAGYDACLLALEDRG